MADEQHSEYDNMLGMGPFARCAEDKNGLAMVAIINSPEVSTEGRGESPADERIAGRDSPGWSTVDRLATLQSFR
jgi:hypothetical protein